MDELAQSLFQLQMEELENATYGWGGKAREDETRDDARLAFLLELEELQEFESQRADRKLAHQLSG